MSDQNTAAELDVDFGIGEVSTVSSRYTLKGHTVRSRSGGIVASGKLAQVKPGTKPPGMLVHTAIPGRAEQAIDMGAVASAIVGGVIPYPTLVRAFADADTLDELKKAIAAHK